MKKAFKIIGIIIGVIIILIGTLGYFGWKNLQKMKIAQTQADYIMQNLDNPNITEKFPTKYFPKETIEPILSGIRENCDWKKKDGKYVDFFTQKNIGGIDQTSFIYEYYLNCDSLRFILSYSSGNEPELLSFNIEPLETENKMIISPEKQLKNR